MEKDKIEQLIFKLFSGEISPEEQSELEEWYASSGKNPSFTDQLSKEGKGELEKKLLNKINYKIRISEKSARVGQARNNAHKSSGSFRIKIAAAVTAKKIDLGITASAAAAQQCTRIGSAYRFTGHVG